MEQEITVVGFAGGGGSCEGIKMALGHSPVVALNHDAVAVGMHTANHPDTIHHCQNIWKAVPSDVLRDVRKTRKLKRWPKIGLAWFSPDCKHFSKAKGGKPVEKNIRDLGWVVLAWAKLPRSQRPRVLIVENVEEYVAWGPLGADNMPDPKRKGETFRKWDRSFQREGYKTEHREIVAADYGSPTTRKRLFWIARNDGLPIVWPAESHGKPSLPAVISGQRLPWRTAAEIIDWSIPCPSIFETSAEIKAKYGIRAIRPLAGNTMARIGRGVSRYVIDCANPFIVPITHTGDARVHGINEPLRTVTTAHRGELALVDIDVRPSGEDWKYDQREFATPFVTKFNGGATGHPIDDPLHTITAAHSDTHPGAAAPLGVVTPFLAPRYLEKDGHDPRTRSVEEPAATITSRGNAPGMLATPFLARTAHGEKDKKGKKRGRGEHSTGQPMPTTTASPDLAVIAPVLSRQFGASTGSPCGEPTPTIMPGGGGKTAVLAPVLINTRNGERPGQDPRCRDVKQPWTTVTAEGSQGGVVAAALIRTDMQSAALRNGVRSPDDPLATITSAGGFGAVSAFVAQNNGGKVGRSADSPVSTITTEGGHQAVAAAFLAQHNTDMVGHSAEEPVSTIVQKGCTQAVVSAGLANLKGSDRRWAGPDAPTPAQCAGGNHIAQVSAYLTKFHGDGGQHAECGEPMHTADCKARFGLVQVDVHAPPFGPEHYEKARKVAQFLRALGLWNGGEFVTVSIDSIEFVIVDIGMRMLTPRELFRAQGFPDSYVIDRQADGTPISKTDQIRMVGNSVCPQVAAALVAANYIEMEVSADGVPEFALQAAE